ncbi:MAG: hypothetical protein ABWY80_10360, partial [Acidimicrobiia bacterium]
TPGVPTVPRPDHFDAKTGIKETGKQAGDLECGMTSQFIQFTDGEKTFAASVLYGKDASPARLAEAYGILESLEVAA